jgi:N-acetylmuramoyl-L-alanine amidase
MLHLPRKQRRVVCSAAWRRGAALLLLAITGVVAADLPDAHHVTAVRFWSLGAVTRIAIQTDGDFQVKTDHLENPDRIFFDLAGTKPTLTHKSLTVIPVSDRFVKQIRVAEPQHNVTRVVLDLETTVEATTSRLENPDRLIIELRAPGGKATEPVKAPVKTPPALIQTPPASGETLPASVKTPPALAEPTPAPRPAEHRQFAPPPTVPSVAPVRAQEAALDPPPVLALKPTPAPADITAHGGGLQATWTAPVPSTLAPAATLTPAATPLTPATPGARADVALPAKRNSTGERSMIRVLGLKVGRVVLDPGHGGHDTGTIGPAGLREKDLVLDVSQRLGRLIQDRMGSEVIYTRSDDTFIPLERRTEIANEAKADLFLSIHANSSTLRSAAGVETFYLNFTTSRSALDVAARENAGSQMSIYELQELLQKIALKDKVEESREFASRVQSALFTLSARTADSRSKDRGVKKAPFVVLIGASMPSVLAEIGFISNAHDESIMRREDYRQRTAEALYKGLSSYANSLSHFQVAQRH